MRLILALFVCFFLASYSVASPLSGGSDEPALLSISGVNNQDRMTDEVHLSLTQLKQIESKTMSLQTRWTNRVHEYYGPLLTKVLEHTGLKGKRLRFTALNDYAIDIDYDFIVKYQPILAWRDDGQAISIRNKGPLWLILPHHQYPELNIEEHTGKMIWQLRYIEIIE